ncbi:hypothetical protein L1987_38171 [Smallanthus sonchifolius]|uniref:Uncharacterized protein n=1 Tax=Smallanthus sonchifolius TaxID=185202 RepID=A0ACB9HJ58_9ASTR|nr:hypothetical protein L1987_38171 [Smallanthus sonchifolius]
MSCGSGRGKHTTRHVSLLSLSGGGYVDDTPGFNQPSLLNSPLHSASHRSLSSLTSLDPLLTSQRFRVTENNKFP